MVSIYANQNWRENAKKMKVDHLIAFKSFDAKEIPYDDLILSTKTDRPACEAMVLNTETIDPVILVDD